MHKLNLKAHKSTDIFFTADEHYFHKNIIKYCRRPFHDVDEMNRTLVELHNAVVRKNSVVIHLGDFSLGKIDETIKIIESLNGRHVFLQGSHDKWLKKGDKIPKSKLFLDAFPDILQVVIPGGNTIVCCHYPMKSWPASYHGSLHVFGHVHGRLENANQRSMDVGVDCNSFAPVSLATVLQLLDRTPLDI